MKRANNRFSKLGEKLSSLRRQHHKTAEEVAGAVEIDKERLLSYERGETRPGEDILNLLISHFDLDEEEADMMWQLADYEADSTLADSMTSQAAIMLLPLDGRIVYSDTFQVTISKQGVIMNFMQSNGTQQQLPVSKVGMSLEQAREILRVLDITIKRSDSQNNKEDNK